MSFRSVQGIDTNSPRGRAIPFQIDVEEDHIHISYLVTSRVGGGGFNGYNIDFVSMHAASPCYEISSVSVDTARNQLQGVRAWHERNTVRINVANLRVSPDTDIYVNVELEGC